MKISSFIIENIFFPVMILLGMTLVIMMIIFIPIGIRAGNTCLEYGYPHSYIIFPNEIKCGRIVNHTEYICSIEDVISKNCIPE